jgi:hypothetical protein
VEFLSGWKLWHEITRELAKFGNFRDFFGGFLYCLEWLGPSRNYFSKTEGPSALDPMRRDCGAIYKNLKGLLTKMQ